MKTWRIHPEAQLELTEATEYYFQIDFGLGTSFDQLYGEYRQQICKSPLLFNIREGITRRVNLTPRFGEYYIAYMIWRDQVVILAIAHARRKPYYWRNRISEAKKMY